MTRTHRYGLAAVAALAACGGGGGGGSPGSVAGLQAPEEVTVVQSNAGAGARLPRGLRGVTGSAYETDTTHFWIHDDSMKALETVNMVLGSLHQTHYYDQTNAGPYRALVHPDNRGEGGDSRGDTGPSYEEWVVDSTRASSSSPQVVHFWLDENEPMGQHIPALIYGRLTVTEEPSDTAPLGVFTLVFKCLAKVESPSSTNTVFQGYLRSLKRTDGLAECEFVMGHGDPDGTVAPGHMAMRQRVHVVGDPSNDSGRAWTEWKQVTNTGGGTHTDQGEYNLQFNSHYVARKDVVSSQVDVYDRTNYETHVFRYGLYDATAETRVSQQSGFPLEDESGHHGWVGYWGMWFPPDASIVNGQHLVRRGFGANAPTTDYTAVVAQGKLEKRTRSAITLGDLVNEDLDTFDPLAGQEVRLHFNGSHWMRVAVRSGNDFVAVNPAVQVDTMLTTGTPAHFWTQGRGSVDLLWNQSPSTSQVVYVWRTEPVTSSSAEVAGGNLTLYGYFRQMRALLTNNQANYLSGESPYFADATGVSAGNHTYVFDRTSLMLTLGGQEVRLGDGVSVTSGPGQFGFDCGPLYATALGSFAEIANQDTTYVWQTGANNWNQLRTVANAQGTVLAFDPPLQFPYTHHENGSQFDGRSFMLQWDGTNLGGIPSRQDTNDNRWYPLINIPSGTVVTASGHDYKIKQLEGEQLMQVVGSPGSVITNEGFDLNVDLSHPDGSLYSDPAIGARPDITAAPLYVGGVSQG